MSECEVGRYVTLSRRRRATGTTRERSSAASDVYKRRTKDRTAIIDDLNEGDEIKVHFDLRGRQWQEKYFTNLNAWRVEKVSTNTAPPVAPAAADSFNDFPTASTTDEPTAEASDDLPF